MEVTSGTAEAACVESAVIASSGRIVSCSIRVRGAMVGSSNVIRVSGRRGILVGGSFLIGGRNVFCICRAPRSDSGWGGWWCKGASVLLVPTSCDGPETSNAASFAQPYKKSSRCKSV